MKKFCINTAYLPKLIIFFYSLIQILPLISFAPGTDEGFYGNVARNIVYEGNLGASLFYAHLGFDQYSFFVYPTFTILQWIIAQIAGFDLVSLRTGMLCLSLIFLITIYLWSQEIFQNRSASILILLMAATSLSILRISRIIRPDIFILTFLTASLFFCTKGINSKKYFYLFLSGCLSMAGMASHPLGGLILANVFIFIMFYQCQKNTKQYLLYYFLGIVSLGIPILLYYLLTSIPLYFVQMDYILQTYLKRINIDTMSGLNQGLIWLYSISNYYVSHRLLEGVTLLILVLLSLKALPKKIVLTIGLCLLVNWLCLAFLYPNKFIDYTLVSSLPFFFLLAGAGAQHYRTNLNKKSLIRIITIFCLSMYLAFNFSAAMYNIYRAIQYGTYEQFRKKLRLVIPQEDMQKNTILGNAQYLFAFPESRLYDAQILRNMVDYRISKTWEEAWKTLKVKYIIEDGFFEAITKSWPYWPAFTSFQKWKPFFDKRSVLLGQVKGAARNVHIYKIIDKAP